jgi:RNA polymerase sigma factor (sigma-70 family)
MNDQDWLARRFEEHRTRLRAVAYRMLGSLGEADDAVQESWIRLSGAETGDVENLGAWLTTVVARISLNMLRARRSRREDPLGPHVPEPIIDHPDRTDPEHEALLADSVGLALLVVLDTLGPAERLAFVLHDIFAVPFDEIAPIVDRSPGAASVASQALSFSGHGLLNQPALINGVPGAVTTLNGLPIAVGALTVRGGKIVAIDILADPERLRELDLAVLGD